jgi:glycosyltransferase involved in cell wall biosynthesis
LKAVIFSPFFYPEEISTGRYNSFLANSLASNGYEVQVVCSHPLFPSWKVTKSNNELSGTTCFRGGLVVRYPRSAILRRAVLESWFSWHVIKTWFKRRLATSDVLISVFPPSLFLFALNALTGARKRPSVGIVHDLQGVYASLNGGLISKLAGKAIHFVERRGFQSCDKLIFLSRSMAERAISEYGLDRSRCVICYPFVSLPPAADGDSTEASKATRLTAILPNEQTHVVYSGALGDKQNPDELLEVLNALSRLRANVSCHVFSAGPHFERIKASAASESSPVSFHGLVDAEDLDELYARSTVQIIPQQFGTGDGSLPSKLPNLMAAGVPVFVICEQGSEVGDMVKKARAGVAAHNWDPHALAAELAGCLPIMTVEPREQRRARLRAFVAENFSVERVVAVITDVAESRALVDTNINPAVNGKPQLREPQ